NIAGRRGRLDSKGESGSQHLAPFVPIHFRDEIHPAAACRQNNLLREERFSVAPFLAHNGPRTLDIALIPPYFQTGGSLLPVIEWEVPGIAGINIDGETISIPTGSHHFALVCLVEDGPD